MPSALPRGERRNAAGDAVWSDPTASPFFPDSAAVIFDSDWRRVAAVPTPRPMPAPEISLPTQSSSAPSSVPPAASVAPAVPAARSTPPSAPPLPSPSPPPPPWSRTDTYATGQLAAPAAIPARQGSVSPGRRSEPSAAYQPVTVYRSTPGTLTPPTLDQIRAQQRADGIAPPRGLLTRAIDVLRKAAG